MTNNDRIQEIKQRFAAITPGWIYNGNEIVLESNLRCGIGGFLKEEDSEFAGNAPDDIAYLLSEVERLQEGYLALANTPMTAHPGEVRGFAVRMLRGEKPYIANV